VLDMTARIDFEETRRRFKLAREQAAAGASVEHYGRAREARRWAGDAGAEATHDAERRAA
jgi:hypothetical protein